MILDIVQQLKFLHTASMTSDTKCHVSCHLTIFLSIIVLYFVYLTSDKGFKLLINSKSDSDAILRAELSRFDEDHPLPICSQQERKEHFRKVCKKYNTSEVQHVWRHLIDIEHKVSYCFIPKAGSSTWKKLIASSTRRGRKLTRNFSAHRILDLRRRRVFLTFKKPRYYEKYAKFFIMRHPMTRLISAFQDKIARELSPTDFHLEFLTKERKYIYETIHKHRRLDQSKNFKVSFSDFIKFVGFA